MLNSKEISETCERLKVYPNILKKIKEMLDLIEKKKVESVDDFEEALIPEVRKFGKEIVQTWASVEEGTMRENLENNNVAHHSKKNCIGIQPLEK
jgi:hypothetical protein